MRPGLAARITAVTVAETERTVIRLWRSDEADRMFDMHRRWEVARWLGSDPKPMESIEQAVASIQRWAEYAARDARYGLWAVEEKAAPPPRRVAGSVLLVPLPLSTGGVADDVEIGWQLHPDAWGRGLATESARAVLDKAWADGHEEIHAVTYPGNEASQRVCERLGMSSVGQTGRWYGVTFQAYRIERSAPGAQDAPVP